MNSLEDLKTYSCALGNADCLAGTFHFDARSGEMTWSDELYRIHGYDRGDIVPTMELALAHEHPDDRERMLQILAGLRNTGGYFSSYHRLRDARQREHRVLTSGEALLDETGVLLSVSGVVVDLTSTVQRETERAARAAIAGALGTRSVIERAEGILMGRLNIGSEDALSLLIARSNNTNTKLAVIAAGLVALAEKPEDGAPLTRLIEELRRSRITAPSRHDDAARRRPDTAAGPRSSGSAKRR